MPQEASVCLNQVGSESEELPPEDSASLHTAEQCIHCERPIRDGVSLYMEDTLLGYMHPDCVDDWRKKFIYLAQLRRRA